MPALLTSTSTRPKPSYTASTRRSSSDQWPTWQAYASARRPVVLPTSCASSWEGSRWRATIATSAPAWAKPSTIARPSPRLPPVTSATLPSRRNRASATLKSALTELGHTDDVPRRQFRLFVLRQMQNFGEDLLGVLTDGWHADVRRARVAGHVRHRARHDHWPEHRAR